MTTSEDLKEEILEFIKSKKEEIEFQGTEESKPFLMTIAEPETDEELEYANENFDSINNDRLDCISLIDELENYINEISTVATNCQKNKA